MIPKRRTKRVEARSDIRENDSTPSHTGKCIFHDALMGFGFGISFFIPFSASCNWWRKLEYLAKNTYPQVTANLITCHGGDSNHDSVERLQAVSGNALDHTNIRVGPQW